MILGVGIGKYGVRKERTSLLLTPYSLLQWLVIYAIVAAPLFIWLYLNPGSEFRISEINQPLEALRVGNPLPALQNVWKIFGVWGWSGDLLWRQNVAGAPIFNPLTALLFYAGVFLMLWRRSWADIFVLLWIATATIPSVVTADAPSTIRMINMLPVLGVPIAIVMHRLGSLSTDKLRLSTTFRPNSWITALTIVFLLGSARTFHFLHNVWPNNEEVQFVWQTALTSAARWLDEQPDALPTTILGWSADTMDPPTMELAMRRNDIPLRFSGNDAGVNAVVLPFGDGGSVRVIRPNNPPINLAEPIATLIGSMSYNEQLDFTSYTLSRLSDFPTPTEQMMPLGNELTFSTSSSCNLNGETCSFYIIWIVDQRIAEPRSIFVHALDEHGETVSQSDIRLPNPASWQVGDHILTAHTLTTDAVTSMRVGVYNSQTGQRLTTPTGADSHDFLLGY